MNAPRNTLADRAPVGCDHLCHPGTPQRAKVSQWLRVHVPSNCLCRLKKISERQVFTSSGRVRRSVGKGDARAQVEQMNAQRISEFTIMNRNSSTTKMQEA